MSGAEAAILIAGGVVAGVVNTLAGAASLLTVPLLVLVGLPGTVANGSNRIGILVQNAIATWRFGAEGVPGIAAARPLVVPVVLGALVGAAAISTVDDTTFERVFGVLMAVLVLPLVLGVTPRTAPARPLSATGTFAVFFAIGVFGGAFQAGVGLLLLAALARRGHDLVAANSVKVVVTGVLTAAAVPVFVARGQVAWLPALVLTLGFIGGSVLGVRLAVRGGERVIRPVLVAAVLALAGRMLGLY